MRDLLPSVAVPRWNANDDRRALSFAEILQLALTGKTRAALDSWRFFDTILLGLRSAVELFGALLEIDVASGAGANSAAGMLDVDAVVECDFKNRLVLAAEHMPLLLRGARQ